MSCGSAEGRMHVIDIVSSSDKRRCNVICSSECRIDSDRIPTDSLVAVSGRPCGIFYISF